MNTQASNSSHAHPVESMPVWPILLAKAGAGPETGWDRDLENLRAKELSLVAHLLIAVLLLFPIFNSIFRGSTKAPGIDFTGEIIFPGMPRVKMPKPIADPTGGGGGGEHSAIPARRGGLAPFEWLQLAKPGIPRNPQAKLLAQETLLGPPEIPVSAASQIGNPLSLFNTDSQGPGADSGFGSGKGGGIGDGAGGGGGKGKQWGYGGEGEPRRPGRDGVGYPECVYCPTPSFSEEARKSKLQGSVTLHIVVGTDGRATNIRVMRGLGMGLDERAVDAVRGWRFKPALGPRGKPVPTEVLIEVTFRLL